MSWTSDSIVKWYDIARKEHVSQKGMNFGINPKYSMIIYTRMGQQLNTKVMMYQRIILKITIKKPIRILVVLLRMANLSRPLKSIKELEFRKELKYMKK